MGVPRTLVGLTALLMLASSPVAAQDQLTGTDERDSTADLADDYEEIPDDSNSSDRDSCSDDPSRCGYGVDLGDGLVGVDNNPDCLTSRLADIANVSQSDFIPVCRDATTGAAVPDAVTADGTPICAPFPAGRLPADWRQTTLPTGAIAMNPDPEALTGLESWFWYAGPTTHRWPSPVHEGRTADCRIIPAPPPVTYTATLTTWTYTINDSRPTTTTTHRPGNQQHPAARHVYRTNGTWDTTTACTWTGTPPTPTTVPCAQRTVPVIEVRPVLRE
jgi:hypothetical protein